MSEPTAKKRFSSLRTAFAQASAHAQKNKKQSLSLLTAAALLGTSALTAPFIATPLGAAAIALTTLLMISPLGNGVVDNALAFRDKKKIDSFTMGVLIGSLNTIPEMAVSLMALLGGTPALGLSHIVGSNIMHTLPILGLTAIVAGGIGKSRGLSWKFNTLMMAGGTIAFGAQLAAGAFSPIIGGLMLAGAGYYLWREISQSKKNKTHDHDHDHNHAEGEACHLHSHSHDHGAAANDPNTPPWINAGWTLASMGALVTASHFLVKSAAQFASSQALIGAFVVALFTALPELTINIKAARKKETDMAVGNVMGCNLFNTLAVGGIASFGGLVGLSVPAALGLGTPLGMLSIAAFTGSAVLMSAALLANKGGLKKWQGYAATGLYVAYAAAAVALNGGKAPSTIHHNDNDEQKTPPAAVISSYKPPELKGAA